MVMQQLWLMACCVGLWAGQTASTQPVLLDDPRVQALATGEEKARRAACDELVQVGQPAVMALLAALDGDNHDLAKMAGQALFRMVQREMSDAERHELAGLLAGQLGEQHSVGTKRELCRLLSYIADEQAVDAMYRYLGETDLQEMVRWAMVRTPGMNGTQALIAAMQITEWQFRLSLVNGLGERGDRRATPILRLLSHSDDAAMRQMALGALARLPDRTSIAVLSEAVEASEPGALALLLQQGEVLADHGMVGEALEVFRLLAKRSNLGALEVCQVAHGLGRVGIDTDAQWIFTAYQDAGKWGKQEARVRAACMQALAAMPDDNATELVLQQMKESTGEQKAAWVRCLGQRAASQPDFAGKAPDNIVQCLGDGEEIVRLAAIQAVEEAKITSTAPQLLQLLGGSSPAVADAAEHALCQMADDALTKQLIATYDQADADQKPLLLRVLGCRPSPETRAMLLRAAESDHEGTRIAAAEGLARVASPELKKTLVAMAERGPAAVAAAALKGCLALASKQEPTDRDAAAEMYVKVFTYAAQPEQIQRALDGIARTAGPDYADLLETLLPMLLEDNVSPAACRAAAALAMQLPDDRREESLPTLQLVAGLIPGDPLADKILEYLGKHGVKMDLATAAGVIQRWWLAGPFPLSDAGKWNQCDFQPADVNLKTPLAIDGQSREWRMFRSTHPRGIVELDGPLGVRDNVFVYAGIRFMSNDEHPADLKLGSDDSVVVWLNGEKVFEHRVGRPAAMDQDHVAVRLKAGENVLVLKIINISANWGFCARLTTPGGAPLRVVPLEP